MRVRSALWLVAASLGAAACATTPRGQGAAPPASPAPTVGMPNPASVNCAQRGGKLSIVSTPAGQTGICTFPSGKQCEEWALMRGECAPG